VKNDKQLRAGLYARVSSQQQTKDNTIASQIEALQRRICDDGLSCEPELCFVDEGHSGSTLERPALEQLRDLAAAGGLDILYVHSPDRLARRYAYQVLLVDELRRCGTELIFLNHQIGTSPEEDLLLQVQGVVAEYERAKILERNRRGKKHAARRGSINALGAAPYGYRYISKVEGGGEAGYQIILEEARVVRQIFTWIGQERLSMGEVARRLSREGIATPRGNRLWNPNTIHGLLKNPAYKGSAAFGKTRVGERRPYLRPRRGQPEHPRFAYSVYDQPCQEWVHIPVPAIVDEELFDAAAGQLVENRVRHRRRTTGAGYLLQGLLVCQCCGYALYGHSRDKQRSYAYYRCGGRDRGRHGGQRICDNTSVRNDLLENAVWEDVWALLSEPKRIEREYRRRLSAKDEGNWSQTEQHLSTRIGQIKRGIARLIDAYENGLLERTEFEPRIKKARNHVKRLESELASQAAREVQEHHLRLVIGRVQEFAERVKNGVEQADRATRRQVILALVKRVEVGQDSVRIIYRVSPPAGNTKQENVRHCLSSSRA